MRLNHVTLPVSDVEASAGFYRRLGLTQIVASSPDYARFLSPAGDTTLSLHRSGQTTAQASVHFEVDDVDAVVADLQGAGFAFECEPVDQPYLWREAVLLDPDGNPIFIYHAGEMRLNPPWRLPTDSRIEKGETVSLPLSGGCMCGGVRFEVHEPLLGALYCHCKRCQRRTGSAFSLSALVAPGSYRIVGGEELIRSWRSPEGGWIKRFCGQCGSQLCAVNPEDPEMIAVRMGSFDEDPGVRPGAHQFTDYAAPWAPIADDGLPRFGERASRDAPA